LQLLSDRLVVDHDLTLTRTDPGLGLLARFD